MKSFFLKHSALHLVLASSAFFFLLTTGCSSTSDRGVTWLSDADLQTCRAAALEAFASGYTLHQRDEHRPILVRVDDWRTPSITVLLPVRETLPAGLTYAYYQFQGSSRFRGRSDLAAYALREPQPLKLVENGLTAWATGPLIPKIKSDDQ